MASHTSSFLPSLVHTYIARAPIKNYKKKRKTVEKKSRVRRNEEARKTVSGEENHKEETFFSFHFHFASSSFSRKKKNFPHSPLLLLALSPVSLKHFASSACCLCSCVIVVSIKILHIFSSFKNPS